MRPMFLSEVEHGNSGGAYSRLINDLRAAGHPVPADHAPVRLQAGPDGFSLNSPGRDARASPLPQGSAS